MAGQAGTATNLASESAAVSSILAANPSLTRSLPAGATNTQLAEFAEIQDFGSIQWDAASYSLNYSQTMCYRPGALPMALAMNDTCNLGFYCPASNATHPPQFCPPYEQCQIIRANKGTCNVQGVYEPKVCDPGFYCPAGGKQRIPCVAGTYCPTGSYQPLNCSTGSICPALAQRQILTVPLAMVIALDVALAIAVAIGFAISKWRKSRPKKYTTLGMGLDGAADDIELLNAPAMAGQSRTRTISIGSPGAALLGDSSPRPRQLSVTSPRPSSTHARRQSGRVDHMSPYSQHDDDSDASVYGDEGDDDYHNSADFQRFIRSMSQTIETKDVGLAFDFENLSFETRQGKKILTDITGTMPRGSSWGIMGGSGAGKSTFVNVLMGKAANTGGTIKINGHTKDMSKYKKLIGYVPQDDIIFPELTVRENILHSARIRLPSSWRDKRIQDHVDSLIACLALTHVQHSRVGDANKPVISGGQRKRVNIGIELAAAPMAIFLDEPTSGLDATSAASIMRLLKAISRLGVTTIAIIHQPREQIFYGFDQLLLLAQGRSVYSGPTEDVQTYFEGLGFAFPQRGNPADTLIDIVTGDGAQYTMGAGKHETDVSTLIDEWNKRGQYGVYTKHLSVEANPKRMRRISNQSMSSTTAEQEENLKRTMQARGASWPAQVYYCWKRAMTQQVRNAGSFFFEIGVGALAGGIIGLSAFGSEGHLFQGIYQAPFTELSSAVDYQSVPQIGLLGAMAIGLAASAPGVKVFGEEKLVYWRETASGHSRSAYYIGKILSTLLRIGLSSLHFSVFFGVLATPMMSFQQMFAANLLYFYCIYGLSSCVSMIVKREDGPLLAVFCSLIIGILGGVAPPLSKVKSWHVEWLWRMSPGVWFTEAYFSQNLIPLNFLYILDLASDVVGFTLGQYTLDIAMLFVIGSIYRIIAFFLLIFIDRHRQRTRSRGRQRRRGQPIKEGHYEDQQEPQPPQLQPQACPPAYVQVIVEKPSGLRRRGASEIV